MVSKQEMKAVEELTFECVRDETLYGRREPTMVRLS